MARSKEWGRVRLTQNVGVLPRPMYCLPQGDFRPAETHRYPGGDQLQHKLAGVTTIVRQVIGKLDADAPLSCHDPHFKWRRARRKAIPERHNQCPLVKSRNIAELQHLAMTRRVGESGFLLARPRGFEPLTFAFGGGSSTLI